jgi:hypothetical protein
MHPDYPKGPLDDQVRSKEELEAIEMFDLVDELHDLGELKLERSGNVYEACLHIGTWNHVFIRLEASGEKPGTAINRLSLLLDEHRTSILLLKEAADDYKKKLDEELWNTTNPTLSTAPSETAPSTTGPTSDETEPSS